MAEHRIPVASVQVRAHDLEAFEECWPRVVACIEDAATRGAKLIVIPEGTVPAYVIGARPVDVTILECAEAHIGRIARRYGATIVYGAAHVAGGATYNTGTVVGPDGVVAGRAEKQLLWHFDERWFARGRSLRPIDTPIGRLGVLVCADGRIPTIARTLVERGAEILVVPTAWVTSGRDPHALENVQADLMINVRARENRVALVAANKVGVERETVAYCGKSAIVDAGGEFVARAGQHEEQTLLAEVTVGAPHAERSRGHWDLRAVGGATERRPAARIAITPQPRGPAFARLEAMAALADVDAILALGDDPAGTVRFRDGLVVATTGDDRALDPAGLVEPRLAGVDLFVWTPERAMEDRWLVAYARTRAAELRAYVIVIEGSEGGRAFAVDPEGTIVCGTFDGLHMAQFTYDRAHAAATAVVPRTDVLESLRAVEAIRLEEGVG